MIGYKRIHRISDVRTSKFRVRILDSRSSPSITTFRAHYDAAPPQVVTISRNAAGKVELGAGKPGDVAQVIHYTTDGKDWKNLGDADFGNLLGE